MKFLSERLNKAILIFVAGCIMAPAFSMDAAAQMTRKQRLRQEILDQTMTEKREYALAHLPNMVHTLFNMDRIDPRLDSVIDEYAQIAYCHIYEKYRKNDFDWHEIRPMIRDIIEANKESYPTKYQISGYVMLGEYDFAVEAFEISEKSPIRSVNSFILYASEPKNNCDRSSILLEQIPYLFTLVLDVPITLDKIPMDPHIARPLLSRMNKQGNTDRGVYVLFEFKVRTSQVLRPQSSLERSKVLFLATLDRMKFYESEAQRHLLYTFENDGSE